MAAQPGGFCYFSTQIGQTLMKNNSLLWRIGTAVLVVGSIIYTATAGRPTTSGKKTG
jgi:hypothetical protein